MSDAPYMTGLLEEIVGVHFGAGPFLVIASTNGISFGSRPSGLYTFGAFTISGAPFTIPGAGVFAPSASLNWTLNPDGSGSYGPPSFGPFSRSGIPSGSSVPVTDVVSGGMESAYEAWVGQYIWSGQTSQLPSGMGGGIAYFNVDGYLIINLAKFKQNLSFQVTCSNANANLGVASYRDIKKTTQDAARLDDGADSVLVTLPNNQVDIVNGWSGNTPAHSIGFGFDFLSGAPASKTVTCNIKTLAVTVS